MKAGMADEKVFGATLKYWPTTVQISCNRWRSHMFKHARIFLDGDSKSNKIIRRIENF
jgi:hypothetical protein